MNLRSLDDRLAIRLRIRSPGAFEAERGRGSQDGHSCGAPYRMVLTGRASGQQRDCSENSDFHARDSQAIRASLAVGPFFYLRHVSQTQLLIPAGFAPAPGFAGVPS